MCRHLKNEKGFTLLEMLIVMLILSFILIATFDMMNMNYQTVRSELNEADSRQEFKILTSFLSEDLLYSQYVQVFNGGSYDSLHYQTKEGEDRTIKFNQIGVYDVRNGEEHLIAKGIKQDSVYPMVREENGAIIFNFYANEINVLMDIYIKPRTEGLK